MKSILFPRYNVLLTIFTYINRKFLQNITSQVAKNDDFSIKMRARNTKLLISFEKLLITYIYFLLI